MSTKTLIPPSRLRWIILSVLFAALAMNYFDRQIVSVLKPTLKEEFKIDDQGYAIIINVFMLFYAIFYPLVGWLVDRFGARIMMLLSIVIWSSSCIGAGLSRALNPFLFFRGTLGMAEPAAYPSQLRAVTLWFPGSLRATANSICQAGSSIGAIYAPPLVAWLTLNFSWHAAFIVPGIAGFIVAGCWWFFYRDPPAEYIVKTSSTPVTEAMFSWSQLWRTRTLWGILLCRLLTDPIWYFCLFWLPGYLQERSGLSLEGIGWFGWIPFLAANLGAITTSALSDGMVRRGIELLRSRKLMLTAAACFAPVCVLTPYFQHPAFVLFLFSIVAIVCLSWLFTICVVVAETFPTANVGSVLGIACGFGAFGGMVFNHYVGKAMDSFGVTTMFAVMAVLHPLAALVLWMTVRREQPPLVPSNPLEGLPAH